MLRYAGGDCRKFLNILDLVCGEYADDDFDYADDNDDDEPTDNDDDESAGASKEEPTIVITDALVAEKLQANPMAYDKDGEMHYDLVSAMIKSIRGSDPDAAIYYMARMIEGGEDPGFIARRLVISASEDIGLANPNALLLANAAFDAVQKIGWPEGRIPLAEACVYLASSPKSNASYLAIDSALQLPDALVAEGGMQQSLFYHPQPNAQEDRLKAQLSAFWGDRFK